MKKLLIILTYAILIFLSIQIEPLRASELEILDVEDDYIETTVFSLSGIDDLWYYVSTGLKYWARKQYVLSNIEYSCSAVIQTMTQSRKISTEEESRLSWFFNLWNDSKIFLGWKIEKDDSYFKTTFSKDNVKVTSYGPSICHRKIRWLLKRIKMKQTEVYELIPIHSLIKVNPGYDQERYILQTWIDSVTIADFQNMLLGMITEDMSMVLSTREVENELLERWIWDNITKYDSLEFDWLNLRYIVMKFHQWWKDIYLTIYLFPDIYGRVAMVISEKDSAYQNLIDVMWPIEIRSDNIWVDSIFDEIRSDTVELHPPSLQELLESKSV